MEASPQFEAGSIFDASSGVSTIPDVLDRLQVTGPTPVLVIIGGADGMGSDIGDKVHGLFERSLAPVMESSGVVVLTGGTDSGVMAIAGKTLSSSATVVGVSPSGALRDNPSVRIQSDHQLSVLTSGSSWGSETDYMVALAVAITQGAQCGVVLLVNGGSVACEEINYFVAAGWPVLAIRGSGGAADDLIAFTEKRKSSAYDWSSLTNADLENVDLEGPPHELRKRFHWYLSQDELLKSAWTYYRALARCAAQQQTNNRRIQIGLQVGSLAIVTIVLIQVQAALPLKNGEPLSWNGESSFLQILKLFTIPFAVGLPIALAAATALSQSVSADRGWRVTRGAAESLKREIYRYRAWLVWDSSDPSVDGRRGLKSTINSALRRSKDSGFLLSVDLTAKRGRPKGLNEGDDELAPLSVASYVSHRIDQQVAYFQTKGKGLRRRAVCLVILAGVLAAGSGTLAGSYYALWTAMAVLLVTALTAYLERNRLTERAARYATASADLSEIKVGVSALPPEDRGQPKVLFTVVIDAESALEKEGLAWEQLLWREVRESRRDSPAGTESDR